MGDWIKAATGVILLISSFVIALLTVQSLGMLVMVGAWLILMAFIAWMLLSYLKSKLGIASIALLTEDTMLLLTTILISAALSFILIWILQPVVKVIAVLALTWIIFKVLVRMVAKEVEADLRSVFE